MWILDWISQIFYFLAQTICYVKDSFFRVANSSRAFLPRRTRRFWVHVPGLSLCAWSWWIYSRYWSLRLILIFKYTLQEHEFITFLAVSSGDKGAGVMTQKTFIFTRRLMMLASISLSLILVFSLQMYFWTVRDAHWLEFTKHSSSLKLPGSVCVATGWTRSQLRTYNTFKKPPNHQVSGSSLSRGAMLNKKLSKSPSLYYQPIFNIVTFVVTLR